MSVELRKGDILQSRATALVNPVNCLGTSGKGLAKLFKAWAPDAQREYERLCRCGALRPGAPTGVRAWDPVTRGVYASAPMIYFFPTKNDWRDPARIAWIQDGLDRLVLLVQAQQHDLTAIPALGCGHGELAWGDVRPLLEAAAARMPGHVLLYEPW